MRKYIVPIVCLLFIILFSSCKTKQKPDISQTDFIYLQDNTFRHKGEPFFPLMLNYIVSYQNFDNQFVFAPHTDYDSVGYTESQTPAAIEQQLLGHFQLIKEMGFNTLRICFDRTDKDENNHYYYKANRKFYISNEQDAEAIIEGLRRFTLLAQQKGLRIMLLIKPPIDSPELEQFTIQILQQMSHNSTIFAYDFMNEPLYFDQAPKRKKAEAVEIVSHWRKMMRQYAPNQLFTIGFSEPIEVFEWDASMLPVDFVEIHTYHPLRVASEIYWYSKYIHKPWMIGETGLPADNDSISYTEQQHFIEEVYQLTRDAGGCGFGWWEFQETPNTHFEAQYTGLLNHTGRTTTADGKYTIMGTVKPAAKSVQAFGNYTPQAFHRPINYYNMLGYNNICIHGRIEDERSRQPIEGAVIRGWNEYFQIGANTFSDKNGNFTLYCNSPCIHFEISAPGKSKSKFNKTIDYQPIDKMAELPNTKLEYHQISYHPFLKIQNPDDTGFSILGFDASFFSQMKVEGNMGTVLLHD